MGTSNIADKVEAQQGTVRPHHLGQEVFRSVLSEDKVATGKAKEGKVI